MRILYLPHAYSQQRQTQKRAKIYPILLAMQAGWYRKQGHEVYWDMIPNVKVDKVVQEPEDIAFLDLPHPDRIFTRWWEYQNNGNFKYYPATYILSATGCWHGKCTFCVENGKPYIKRPVDDVISELAEIHKLRFKEVFDDSATFPDGDWLKEFCIKKIENKETKDLIIGCNMRIGADTNFIFMKKAGFRMLLFGIESANQHTLDKIQKGISVYDIIPTLQQAKKAGLDPHIAVMFGYRWEENQDSERTLELVHHLLKKGYAKTAQASFLCSPCEESAEEGRKFIRKIYDVASSPQFWATKGKELKSLRDILYLFKQIKTGIKERFYA